jgi:hypothetical protein
VNEIILDTIRQAAKYTIRNESEFAEKVRAASNLRQETEVRECKKRFVKAEQQCGELNTLIKKLYETYALADCVQLR